MKILYITTRVTGSGGVAKVLSLKASYLAENFNHEVHILSSNDKAEVPFFKFSPKVNFHFVENCNAFFKVFYFISEIRKWVKQVKPDVVLITDNGFKSFLIPFLITKSKLVYELHASNEHFLHSETYKNIPFYKSVLKRALKKCHSVVFLNERQKLDFLIQNKQFVIPNPIEFYNDELKHKSIKRVIAVGRITPLKGYERMLHSWKEVVANHPNYILDIFGAVDDTFHINNVIQSLKIEDNVFLHGAVKNINDYYKKTDFLLHASYDECFPMVFLEAINFGLPIICFDLKTDLVNSNYCLVANNNNEFIENIIKLICDENLRLQLSQNAKKYSKYYSIEEIAKIWNSFLIDTTNIS